jgi:hypothetical protein
MAAMDVGWTDVGTWPVLLEVLGAAGIEGGVVEAGEAAGTAPDDLVIERGEAGLVVRGTGGGTIIPDRPIAHLRGACDAREVVQSLLDRCGAAEAGA